MLFSKKKALDDLLPKSLLTEDKVGELETAEYQGNRKVPKKVAKYGTVKGVARIAHTCTSCYSSAMGESLHCDLSMEGSPSGCSLEWKEAVMSLSTFSKMS